MISGTTKENEALKNACINSREAIEKLKTEKFDDLKSKLDFVIGSYEYDKNPVGLHEFAKKTLDDFKSYKKQNPRKLSKQVIDKLEKSIANFEGSN
jgi:hypothetical protein